MLRFPERTVLAECGDLALAKECVADLRAAKFGGTTQILRRPIRNNFEFLGSNAYGSVSGTAIARSIMVGGIIGALLAGVIVALLPPAIDAFPIDLAVVAISVALGGLGGALMRYRFLKSVDFDYAAQRSRFLVRCKGEPAQLAKAFDVLGTSACQAVVFDEGSTIEATSIPNQTGSDSLASMVSYSVD